MNTERHFGWMWIQACEALDHAERLQRQFLRYTGPGVDAAIWEPPVDIHETRDGLSLLFALPGVVAEQIEVTLEPNALTVSALRPLALSNRDSVIRRLEIPHGRFVRRVPLPGRMQVAETRYVNGLLEVRLTAAPTSRARE
jgi:HSP20 family molecular chaperone IbpA